ncbi:MAG: ABC transporter permease, partial [Gemmatimonadales bacterium]
MLHRVRAALVRIRELFRHRAHSAAERDDEFAFHLEMETAENIRRGMSDAEAHRAAMLRFGGTQRFREETRDARGVVMLDNLTRDVRFAFRRLHRAPAFAAGVIATLGIGMGVAVGIGTIVYGVLLRDLPYDKPGQLVHVGFHTDGLEGSGDMHSSATFLHFAQSAHAFTNLGAYQTSDAWALTDGDAAERVTVAMMSPSAFDALGVRPLLGALFARTDTSWFARADGQFLPILISQDLWERRYGADPAIIGRHIDIDHGPRMVIAVLPRSFDFPSPSVSVWYPAAFPVKRPQITSRTYTVFGRLRDGTTMDQAQAELTALLPSLPVRFPSITPALLKDSRARVSVESLKSATVAGVRAQLVLLGVLVAVILLIATTNVVNLFLLRTERTGQEIAIALSLGAGRLTLARRFVVEGVVLGLASGFVAIPAAALALSTKFGFTEREIPRLHEVSFTAGTIVLILASAALIGGTVGLIGLTRTGMAGLSDRLRATRASSSLGWRRAQDGLVALQVAIALALLVAAGLLGRSFWNLKNAHIGFEPANAMTFQVSLPFGPTGITSYADVAAFHAKLMDRLAALPGVTSVGGALHLPLGGGTAGYELQLRAGDDAARPLASAFGNVASGDYFRTMKIPLLAGRTFQSGDLRGGPAVIVSERLAMSIFGTADVVGRSIVKLPARPEDPSTEFRIVGVAGDIQQDRIEDGYTPTAYFPLLRDGDGLPPDSNAIPYRPSSLRYVIRGSKLPGALVIERMVSELDRRVPAANIRMLGSLVDDATSRVRLTLLLIAVAGAAALLLGVIGVYSVVAYAANGRMREFGIRLALGAAPSRIGGMVLGDGVRLVAIGTLAGLAAALGATRFLRVLLYEVQPTGVAEFGVA